MNRRRPQLTPVQRSAKNERDRRHRKSKKMFLQSMKIEFERLQALVEELRNENTSLRRGNDVISNLQNIVLQQREQILELHQKNRELEEMAKQVLSPSLLNFI
ncbi:hypothetical protein Goari_007490, partial [Gossypium aridum]|nr:hypothetical protein [Gossypium aridum]